MKSFNIILFLIGISSLSLSQEIHKDISFRHISLEEGLPNNTINVIFQDKLGFLWTGTLNGLARYDGYTYTNYFHSSNDSVSIPDNTIIDILEDSKGELWLASYKGATRYDRESDSFETIPFDSTIGTFDQTEKIELLNTAGKKLCMATNKGQFLIEQGSVRLMQLPGALSYLNDKTVCLYDRDACGNSLVLRSDSLYLIQENGCTATIPIEDTRYPLNDLQMTQGDEFAKRLYVVDDLIYSFNDTTNIFEPVALNIYLKSYSTEIEIDNIYEDSNSNIWVGTREHGLVFSDRFFETIYMYQSSTENTHSLSINKTTCFYEDIQHNFWIGTWRGGVNFINSLNIKSFKTILKNADEQRALNYPTVLSFYAMGNDTILYGTGGGGMIVWNRINDQFSAFTHIPGIPESLASNSVLDIIEGDNGELWIACYGGLSLLDKKKKTISSYYKGDGSRFKLPSNDIRRIVKDLEGNYWVVTLGGGLIKYVPDRGAFPFTMEESGIISDNCLSIYPDSRGNLWIGTYSGISVYNTETDLFTNYSHNPADSLSLCNDWVFCFLEDRLGAIWIGTKGGLSVFRPESGVFNKFTMEEGLPSNMICGLLEGDDGQLWISTDNGLVRLNPSDSTVRVFDKSNGLQSNDFLIGSYYKSPEGEMFFGGSNGFSYFFPEDISLNEYLPPVYASVSTGSLKSELMSDPVYSYNIADNKVLLSYYESRILNFEFVALNYSNSLKNEYAYKLEGIEDNWKYNGQKRDATYTNLSSGKYTFKVKASNNDGIWNETGSTISIIISPPWWRTWWAFVVYTLISTAILLLFKRSIVARTQLQSELKIERLGQEKTNELHRMKLRFFTNVSHEFRTPLSLIISPVDELMKLPEVTGKLRNQMLTIQRNSRRLLRLVNQLLDISKMEKGYLDLVVEEGDIVEELHSIFNSFKYIAEKKSIEYRFISHLNSHSAWFDRDKLEKILYNILSNAFKYTNEKGMIHLEIDIDPDLVKNNYITIRIKDTGIGISKESVDKIFDIFYQVDEESASVEPGSGIGLALVKGLIHVYHGKMRVNSDHGTGTEFILELPISGDLFNDDEFGWSEKRQDINPFYELPVREPAMTDMNQISDKEEVLIVEDNIEMRNYLISFFMEKYHISEASNGDEGLVLAYQNVPDLIISDIMMPGMDGIEMCKRIKKDVRTSHIPVILLTAKSMDNHMVEGMESGADTYIIKPFNTTYLEATVRSLLRGRRQLRESFGKLIRFETKNIAITSLDETFLIKIQEIVEENMSNPDFNVDMLGHEIGMSRTNLYKKMISLTDCVPTKYIRILRIKRAAQYMERGQLTVSEVIHKVGIRSRSYFIKSFKEVFEVTPTQYIEKRALSNDHKQD